MTEEIKSPLYITGYTIIDQQHLELLALMDRLIINIESQGEQATTDALFNHITQELRQHFDIEERLMLKLMYSDTDAHIGLHMKCLRIVTKLIYQSTYGKPDASLKPAYFLRAWLLDHFNSADKHYTEFGQKLP